jgi:hypothetical protein
MAYVVQLDIPAYRTSFPEFANVQQYPTEQVTLYATVAEQMLPQNRWNNLWTYGVSLYVSHRLTIAGFNQQSAAAGGTPGVFTGAANNEAVGSVSAGYDSQGTSTKDAGQWNLTTYGKELYELFMLVGAGPVQLL